jgi:hypothetical protein
MIQVSQNRYVGNEQDCFMDENPEYTVTHACKSPCHQKIIGYKGSISSNHPFYLTFEKSANLFLNIIDPDVPLFKHELFTKSLDFISSYIPTRKVLVHCNNGQSRAPSIAMLYLAKRGGKINNQSFLQAANDFKKLYSHYQPGRGIAVFLHQNWEDLR